jgi:hypothetical protein
LRGCGERDDEQEGEGEAECWFHVRSPLVRQRLEFGGDRR